MFRYGINLVESSEPDINHPICINSINEQGSLGSGNYGDVYLAKNQISNVSYAAKVLNKKTDDISDKELMNLCQEVIILSQLNHPSILKYKGHSPENILIDDFMFPKIADFGLSKDLNGFFQPSGETFVGTPKYMAPEIFYEYKYSKASDAYAFSLIVYELMTIHIPFEDVTDIYKLIGKLQKNYRPPFETSIPDSYRTLIESCWNEIPSKRPTFDKIVDDLKNDRGFITENVDENEYRLYIEYIEKYNCSFNKSKIIDYMNIFKSFSQNKIQDNIEEEEEEEDSNDPLEKIKIYPLEEFKKLNDKCKKMILKASNDTFTHFKGINSY